MTAVGATAFTRIGAAYSIAAARVKPTSPALENVCKA